MTILTDEGKLTSEWQDECWKVNIAIQCKYLRDVEAAVLALTAKGGVERALTRLAELTAAVQRYRDMREAEE